jgi:hypothetical protein
MNEERLLWGDRSIKDSLILIGTFFFLAPISLVISIFTLVSINSQSKLALAQTVAPETWGKGVQVYASLPETMPTVSIVSTVADARAEIVKQYLAHYDSPLVPYATHIVEVADKYNVDFRLITAIAQQESNLCKKIPPESYNCWGWGIHSRGTFGFDSYKTGIDTVTKGLREEYLNKGYMTIEEIMGKYTPSSNGSWANGVSLFMSEME